MVQEIDYSEWKQATDRRLWPNFFHYLEADTQSWRLFQRAIEHASSEMNRQLTSMCGDVFQIAMVLLLYTEKRRREEFRR